MPKIAKIITAAVMLMALAACGNNPNQRAASGVMIGVPAGTVGALLVSGNPFMGAFVGGATGGLVGMMTEKNDVSTWWE